MELSSARQAQAGLRAHLQAHVQNASFGITSRSDGQPGYALLVNLAAPTAREGDDQEALVPSVFEGFPVVVRRVAPAVARGAHDLQALEAQPEVRATFDAIHRSGAFTLAAAHAAFVGQPDGTGASQAQDS